ncbi:MAG: hypothetical protein HQK77_09995 [Desulfobacterales bacterium]|nr:hypothetical protein [Desulfobacterales bacterium]
MNTYQIFIIRLVLGITFSILLTRIFFQDTTILFVSILAGFMVVMAYFLERIKKNKK